MADQSRSTDPASGSVCPWCSAVLTPDAVICPSCGANLAADEEHELPGVTAVDQDVVRGLKKTASRSRLLSWISGEYEATGPSVVEAGALAPPDPEVQREILRLEIAAEVANLQAEVDARYAEAIADGRVSELPDGVEAMATGSSLDDLRAAVETTSEGAASAGPAAGATEPAEADPPPVA
jgi:hypothetical protein